MPGQPSLPRGSTPSENSPKKLLHEELLDHFPGVARLGRSDTTAAAKEVLAILAKKRVNPDVAGSKRLREWRSFRESDGTRPRGARVVARVREGRSRSRTESRTRSW